MRGKLYNEEFKIEAVKQLTVHGYPVQEVANRLGVTHSLYAWKKKYGLGKEHAAILHTVLPTANAVEL